MNKKSIKFLLYLGIIFLVSFISLNPLAIDNNSPAKKSNIVKELNNIDSINTIETAANGDGYTINTNAPYSWIEIKDTGTRLNTISEGDDEEETISFLGQGWNFTFYKTNYSSIQVSSNGWMSFADEGQTQLILDGIPSQVSENIDCVALLAEDLNLDNTFLGGGGDVYYNFSGTEPNRYLIIEYYQAHDFYNGELLGDFEVIFYENGTIKFQYKNINNLDNFEPIIGLDHGDMTNYNSYHATLPLTSKAISFFFTQLDNVNYELDFSIGNKFLWKVNEINHTAMENVFGSQWEEKFGLMAGMVLNEKTKINISSIKENSTHWEIKYDVWDWIDISDNFGETPDVDPITIYRKEPLNYTQPHNLSNLMPFFLPIYTTVYLRRANLTESYNTIIHSNDYTIVWVNFEGPSMGDYILGNATYDEHGFLNEMNLEYWNGGKSYPAFEIVRIPIETGGSSPPGGDDDDDDNKETNPFIDFITSPIGLISITSISSSIAIFGISLWYFKHKKTIQVKKMK